MIRPTFRKLVSVGLAAASLVGVSSLATPAEAVSNKDRAITIMNQSLTNFIDLKSRRERPFDWSDDGCSVPRSVNYVLPNAYLTIFKKACQRHDFGYRNFGNGLRLDRTATRRKWIDDKFKADMLAVCNRRESQDGIDACEAIAVAFYTAVRLRGASAFGL